MIGGTDYGDTQFNRVTQAKGSQALPLSFLYI